MSDVLALIAAKKWNYLRLEAVRLRSERAECICEHEGKAEPDVGWRGSPPCWREWIQTGPEDRELKPIDEWCAPCLKRQSIHEQYRATVKARGAAMRSLQRRLAAAPGDVPAQREETVSE